MGRSKTRSNIFKKPSNLYNKTKQPKASAQPKVSNEPSKSSALDNISSGVTTGIGMGLGMEAARAASNTLFNTNNEHEHKRENTHESVNQPTIQHQQIVGSHNCEDLLKDLKLCLNTKKSLIDCDGILDRYHRCLRNEY